ncbi:hypothetical protein [Burkholderia sp. 8Y]|uniref:hypothetical protein n=1 Tax=Burkholderia sp. 8Y TaxID=2653133 RepID=UPI00135CDC8B|nr:hypothetical protein [Burkholderia sp. 8Y]
MIVIEVEIHNRLTVASVQSHLATARIRVPSSRLTVIWRLGNVEYITVWHVRLILERLRITKQRAVVIGFAQALEHRITAAIVSRIFAAEYRSGNRFRSAKPVESATTATAGSRAAKDATGAGESAIHHCVCRVHGGCERASEPTCRRIRPAGASEK